MSVDIPGRPGHVLKRNRGVDLGERRGREKDWGGVEGVGTAVGV